jgi:hypothetical protein
MRIVIAMALAISVGGCAAAPKTIWLRADGQGGRDPVLAQQFEIDRTICQGERQRADLSGTTFTGGGLAGIAAAQQRSNSADQVASGCMAQKGYVLVLETEAAAKQQEFAEIAAEKARREAGAKPAVTAQRR